jgi:hypothetical protein
MCDYSLKHVKSRPARVGEKLITHHFGTGTRGFRASDDQTTAVCVLPGTELAFGDDVRCSTGRQQPAGVGSRTAIFRQVDKDVPYTHHDALEFPCGEMVLLTHLIEGQEATVLQLPAQPHSEAEAIAQTRVPVMG